MTASLPPSQDNEAFWRDFLTRGHSSERQKRRVYKRIPHEPRCKICAAPFAGIGAPMMRMIGKRPSDQSPAMCTSCFTFLGDELVAMFFPLLSGERHAARAVEAALALLRATGHGDAGGPWAPIGAGVHTGIAWVGAVGEGAQTELTALGDTVNTAAPLASAARGGEVLVTTEAATAAGLNPQLQRRRLELKGKQLLTEVVTLTVAPGG